MKNKLRLMVLILLLLTLASPIGPSQAKETRQVTQREYSISLPSEDQPPLGGLDIVLTFDAEGNWVADGSLKNVAIQFVEDLPFMIRADIEFQEATPESIVSAARELFGLNLYIPQLDSRTMTLLTKHGVQHSALRLLHTEEGLDLGVYENNRLLLETQLSTEAVDFLLGEIELGDAAGVLLDATQGVTITTHFPTESTRVPVSFEDVIEPDRTPPNNLVEIGATVKETGTSTEIVSVAGFTAEEIDGTLTELNGLPLADLIPIPFAEFEVQEVDATLGRNGLEISDNNGRAVNVLWDQEGRAAIWELVPLANDLLGLGLPELDEVQPMIEEGIADSEIRLALHVDDEPQESLPTLQVSKPLNFELGEDRALWLEGLYVGHTQLDYASIEPLLPVGMSWSGENREARTTINGDRLPILFLEKGATVNLESALSQNVDLPESVPWEKIDMLLENVHVNAVLSAQGEIPSQVDLDYDTAEKRVPVAVSIVPQIVLDHEGHVGFGWPPSRLSGLLEAAGVPITASVKPYVGVIRGIDEVGVVVGPNTLAVDLNGESLGGLRWDSETRQSLTQFVPLPEQFLGLQQEDLTAILVGETWRGQWGLRVKLVPELPPSFLERFTSNLGIFPGADRQ